MRIQENHMPFHFSGHKVSGRDILSTRRWQMILSFALAWCVLPAQAATTITGSTGTLATVPAATGRFTSDNIAGNCHESFMDTDPVTQAAYFIVEPRTATARCSMSVTDDNSKVLVDLTTVGVPAVAYLARPGEYTVSVMDLDSNAVASTTTTFGGTPRLPALGSGANTAAGCSTDLQRRSVIGAISSYTNGWNIVSHQGAANCPHTVGTATVATDLVQVAIQDPFDLSIVKSVTVPDTPSAGQSVAYSFLITNGGGVPWTLSLADPLPGLSAIDCPVNPLPANRTTTCTASYTITDADVQAGTVSNSANVTGRDDTRADATGASVTTSDSAVAFTPASAVPPAETQKAVPTLSAAALAALAALVALGACVISRRHPRGF